MSTNNNGQIELNDLMNQLGEFGLYQLVQHILHGLAWVVFGVHMMGFVFVFPVVTHRCYIAEVDGVDYLNGTLSGDIHAHIPTQNGKLESCTRYGSNGTVQTCEQGHIYNFSNYFHSSRISEWDMVCDRSWMRAMLQSIFLLGTLTGSIIFGYFADKFGRKPIFCISGVIQLFVGAAGAFIENYYVFAFSMFWYGFFGGAGAVVTSIALTMELVGPTMRNICGTFFTIWLGIGGLVVATWAYYLLVPARMLQLIFALHSVLLWGHYWFMDESICWLWTNGSKEKAIDIVERAMKFNGKELKLEKKIREVVSYTSAQDGNSSCKIVDNNNENSVNPPESTPSIGPFELFLYPKLRCRTLVMLFCWFANALSYFGLSFNSVNLHGNPYFMFVIIILAEIPGHIVAITLVAKTGKKAMYATSIFIAGAACIAVPFIGGFYFTMVAKLGSTVCFDVLTSYSAELFPTQVRNTAVGMCVMGARAGAALIPLINLLETSAEAVPIITFGIAAILSSIFTLLVLPETMNKAIPQTIQDVESSEDVNLGCCLRGKQEDTPSSA